MSLRVAGRWAGAFFLAAFAAYGVGSALGGRPAGVALVVLNSVLVAAIGALAFRALRRAHPAAAWTYLVARGAEAFLLTAGIVLLHRVGAGAADVAYQLAMLALGLGSLPLCLALDRQRWLPRWLAGWGFAGYALLAVGAAAELMGAAVGVVLAVPGGLFEIAFALLLLARGFAPSTAGRPAVDEARSTATAGDRRPGRAALGAGLGLLVMAALAGLANFGVLERLVATDPAQTTARLVANQRALTLAVVALFAVACLDVLVAWALRAFFVDTHRTVALLSAWCRTGYAIVFAVAIAQLIAVAGLLRDGPGSDRLGTLGPARLTEFDEVWNLGLLLFGVHLLLVGWLAWRSRAVPTWVGVLVAIAGAGYLADSIGALVPAGYPFPVATVTFVGEVVLMGWLLVFAARSRRERPAASSPSSTVQPV
ncbi:DUF4386 domain-containing protein [Micromonospora sp. PLK6-60]|uniref:DUF4386 domain-containing protein n=1 Tax=Micromonospora sp. PLK6-60 TaxID=2873383 RepID=UPI001CA767CE|nr:DUF4386 domain-containing protein [Micromonospora sp. PLK6-60]MBY8875985.1 DUF4386 domain-containing protein [Micromonospora sp. PLK6-60]